MGKGQLNAPEQPQRATQMLILNSQQTQQLHAEVNAELSVSASDWLQQQLRHITEAQAKSEVLLLASAQTRRQLGNCSVRSFLPGDWTLTQLARVLLLAQALHTHPLSEREQLFRQVFRSSDDDEKICWLKALSFFDANGLVLDLALQAGRTNNSLVFSAIALSNNYPAHHYEPHAFHQLVLKALFMDLDIRAIAGLKERLDKDLSRLAFELVAERLAAGRNPPATIAFAILFVHLDNRQRQLISQFLTSSTHQHFWRQAAQQQGVDQLPLFQFTQQGPDLC
jgi:hypothetical protein